VADMTFVDAAFHDKDLSTGEDIFLDSFLKKLKYYKDHKKLDSRLRGNDEKRARRNVIPVKTGIQMTLQEKLTFWS
jgi:hypothetical protein